MARYGAAQVGAVAARKSSASDNSDKPKFGCKGQAWFCTTGLPSNIVVEIDEMLFHLHKFPLISRSGKISTLVAEATSSDDDDAQEEDDYGSQSYTRPISAHHGCRIQLQGMPGGPEAFQLVAKFCYGVKVKLTAMNVAPLRCAAEYLHMTEEYVERNLIAITESFINNVILRSWKDSVMTLKSCETLLPMAEDLSLVRKCVDSIALKVCTQPSLLGWPVINGRFSFQSPKGKVLLNAGHAKARTKNAKVDWWYEDTAILNLPLFKCVISALEEKGLGTEAIASALMYYSRKSIPGMQRRQEGNDGLIRCPSGHSITTSNAEQRFFLETIETLLPTEEGVVTSSFLSSLLKISKIVNANEGLRDNLEKRIGAQLEQATIQDILIPSYSNSLETLYDVDCVWRIVQHYLGTKALVMINGHIQQPKSIIRSGASSSTVADGMVTVANLMDSYLAEIASDANLKLTKFQAILEALPQDVRALDDGMYKAIDIFLKAHPWMEEREKDALCNAMNPEKLSQQACKHAAQNKSLPLRVVAQVLFLEQAQLRAAFMGALEATISRPSLATSMPSAGVSTFATMPPVVHRVSSPIGRGERCMSGELRTDFANLRSRIKELERKCAQLQLRLQHRRASGWAFFSSKLSCHSLSDLTDNTSDPLHQTPPTTPSTIQSVHRK